MVSMPTRIGLLVALAFAAPVLGGCQSTNSENVKTPGMAATFRATDDTIGTVAAHAQLKIGSTYIDLSGGDAIFCDNVKLGKSEGAFNEIDYEATIARLAPGQSYVFEFRRPATSESHLSYVIAPDPVVIAAPGNGSIVSSKAPLSVAWTAAAMGGISISVTGSGVRGRSYSVGSDQGSYTIPANDLVCGDNLVACSGVLTVTRTVVGSGDPDFESADVKSITSANVDIQVQAL